MIKTLLLCICKDCSKHFMVWQDQPEKKCPHCNSENYEVFDTELKGCPE